MTQHGRTDREMRESRKWPRPLMEGAFKLLPMPDLLQSLAHQGPCQVLHVVGNQPIGFIWLDGKKILRCRTRELNGYEAFVHLLGLKEGGFRVYELRRELLVQAKSWEALGTIDQVIVQSTLIEDELRRDPEHGARALETLSLLGRLG